MAGGWGNRPATSAPREGGGSARVDRELVGIGYVHRCSPLSIGTRSVGTYPDGWGRRAPCKHVAGLRVQVEVPPHESRDSTPYPAHYRRGELGTGGGVDGGRMHGCWRWHHEVGVVLCVVDVRGHGGGEEGARGGHWAGVGEGTEALNTRGCRGVGGEVGR